MQTGTRKQTDVGGMAERERQLREPLLPLAVAGGEACAPYPEFASMLVVEAPPVAEAFGGAGQRRHPLINDLDRYLKMAYVYFMYKGIASIAMTELCKLLSFAFVTLFCTFLLYFVDYGQLLRPKPEASGHTFPVLEIDIHALPRHARIIMGLLTIVFIMQIVLSLRKVFSYLPIFALYHDYLSITEAELQHIAWPEVVHRLETVRGLAASGQLTSDEIIKRITRNENYMIGLVCKKGLLRRLFSLPIPCVRKKPVVFSKSLELWLLQLIYAFDPTTKFVQARREVSAVDVSVYRKSFRKWCIVIGVVWLLFIPAVLVGMAIYFFFRYGEELHSNPRQLSMRRWTSLARWRLRNYNEVDHHLEARLNAASEHAQEFLDQFPSPTMLVIACRFFGFVIGSLVIVLVVLSLVNSDFVFELWGFSSVLYLTALTVLLGVFRSLVPPTSACFDPDAKLRRLVRCLGVVPGPWHGRASHEVRDKVARLYASRVYLWCVELLAIFVTPYFLIVTLPRHSAEVVGFFRAFVEADEAREPFPGDAARTQHSRDAFARLYGRGVVVQATTL
eukprot:TRINITY_DN4540_c0_g1_i2.p1 TRINITY_DN4540_c0_g1~~TRINITY_DN4540_c0_g1_i2.p1  ORF type:complete len:562 (+),score=163.99 TRINITY_DN4540_c0_g1_i2:294-1979(+)